MKKAILFLSAAILLLCTTTCNSEEKDAFANEYKEDIYHFERIVFTQKK